MDALVTLALLAALLAAPCLVQLLLWAVYGAMLATHALVSALDAVAKALSPGRARCS